MPVRHTARRAYWIARLSLHSDGAPISGLPEIGNRSMRKSAIADLRAPDASNDAGLTIW
jgi:hypothetical protein